MQKGPEGGAVYRDEPFYLEFLGRLKPEYVRTEVENLAVTQTMDGGFEARNSGRSLMGLGLNVVVKGRDREETIRRATEAVRRNVELWVCEHIFIRGELLRGLPYVEQGVDWFLDAEGFREMLERVEQRRLGIFGVESYELVEYDGPDPEYEGKMLYENTGDVQVYEEFPGSKDPSNPRWYRSAFKEMLRDNPNAVFNCTLDIPPSILGFSAEWGAPRDKLSPASP